MIPTQAEVLQHYRNSFKRMVEFAKVRFDNDQLNSILFQVSFRDCKRWGQAGIKTLRGREVVFIKLNVFSLIQFPVQGFTEYKSYARNSRIGTFATQDWRVWADALLAHEFAHVLQFTLPRSNSKLRLTATRYEGLGTYENAHGDFFQSIYRVPREEFINEHVTQRGTFAKQDFDRPASARKPTVRKMVTDSFPYKDRTVRLPGGIDVRVVAFLSNARKYKFVGETVAGKRYRFSQMHVNVGLQSA